MPPSPAYPIYPGALSGVLIWGLHPGPYPGPYPGPCRGGLILALRALPRALPWSAYPVPYLEALSCLVWGLICKAYRSNLLIGDIFCTAQYSRAARKRNTSDLHPPTQKEVTPRAPIGPFWRPGPAYLPGLSGFYPIKSTGSGSFYFIITNTD